MPTSTKPSQAEFARLIKLFTNPYIDHLDVYPILKWENKRFLNFLKKQRTKRYILALAQDRKALSFPQCAYWKDHLSEFRPKHYPTYLFMNSRGRALIHKDLFPEFSSFLGPYFNLEYISLITATFDKHNISFDDLFNRFLEEQELQQIEKELRIEGS